jgi:conjugative relaxase-like TrwC/TraI family protein
LFKPNKLVGTGRGQYYLNLAKEDYYFLGGTPLRWYENSVAEMLGLSGIVLEADFHELTLGQTPDGERVKNYGEDRVSGFDCTISWGKTISAFWSQASDDVRKGIEEEAIAVAKVMLEDLEASAYTRRGVGGTEPEKVGIIVAYTLHFTARKTPTAEPDPQLHVHCYVMNATKTSDGKTRTLDGERLYADQKTRGALARAELAARLERRFGLEFQRIDGWKKELKGPESLHKLADEFSHRRKEVLAKLAAEGTSSAKAAEKAALSSRAKKEPVDEAKLFDAWKQAGKAARFTLEETISLMGKAPKRDVAKEARRAVDAATKKLGRESSTFTEREYLRELADQSLGLTVSELKEAAAAQLKSEIMVCLGTDAKKERHFTTKENWETEKRLLEAVGRMRGAATFQAAPKTVRDVLRFHTTLTDEQRAAVTELTQTADAVSVLVGNPGTGKSTTLNAVREVYERDSRTIIGCCTSAKAALELERSSGIKSYTIAKLVGYEEVGFKGDLDKPTAVESAWEHTKGLFRAAAGRPATKRNRVQFTKNSVLVVDEAGVVGSRAVERLVREIDAVGGRIHLVGDPKQLQPVCAGASPLGSIVERLGRASTLRGVVRQSDLEDRSAIKAYAAGRTKDALMSFARRGKVVVGSEERDAVTLLMEEWRKFAKKKPQDVLIFARTREEVRALNLLCQEQRLEAGELGPGIDVAGTTVRLSERLRFLKNDKYIGVANGQLGTVTAVNPLTKTLTVRLDGMRKIVSVPVKEYDSLTLGYALTTHAGQGTTCGRSLIYGSELGSRELSFVQLSRHKTDVRLFLDHGKVNDALARYIHSLNRSDKREIAHDHARSLAR